MNIETTSATASDITPSVDYDTLASGLTYSYADTFVMEDTEYRKLYLLEDVDDTIFEKINYFILRYNEMDDENKTPIKREFQSSYISIRMVEVCMTVSGA